MDPVQIEEKDFTSLDEPPGTHAVENSLLRDDDDVDVKTPMRRVFQTPELFDKLLKYLPRKDLLKCRLIDHSWNIQIRDVLLKRHNYISLNGWNYHEYGTILESSLSSGTIGHYCSLFANDYPRPNCEENYDEDGHLDLIPFRLTERYIKKMQGLKPRFLKQLHIDFSDQYDDEDEKYTESIAFGLRIIKLCAADLRILHLEFSHNSRNREQLNVNELTFRRFLLDCSFPELQKLRIETTAKWSSNLVGIILNNAPKLKVLRLKLGGSEIGTQVAEKSVFSVCNYLTEVTINSDDLGLEFLSNVQLPVLNKFTINFTSKDKLDQKTALRLMSCLEKNCTLLSTLDFYFHKEPFMPLRSAFLPELPFLKNLTHLGCLVETESEDFVTEGNEANFLLASNLADLAQNLPSLKYFCTTPGTYFCDEKEPAPHQINFQNNCSVINHLVFHKVNIIKLQNIFSLSNHFEATFQWNHSYDLGTIHQLTLLFPNVRRVIIAPLIQTADHDMEEGSYPPQRIWTRVIEASLKEFRGLKELVIENCFEDYFSEIWSRLQLDENGIQQFPGITLLKLPSIDWFNKKPQTWFYHDYPVLDLLTLIELLPNLQILELDAQFIGINHEERQSKLHNFQTRAPGLKIIIL